MACKNKDIDIIAINDLVDMRIMSHLLKHDSVFGKFDGKVEISDSQLIVDEKEIAFLRNDVPNELPWGKMDIDVVVESTGVFAERERAMRHLTAGAKRVLISAPAKQPDITIVPGVNGELYDPDKHRIISMASCTTNCLAPVASVLNSNFRILNGFMTTVHAYTNDQVVLDFPHRDLRRARSAAMNIIPTTTGAAKSIGEVIPDLKGKLEGLALRVPVPDVSMVDLTVMVEKHTNVDEVNRVLQDASINRLRGIVEYVEEPIVSQDILGNAASSIVDGLLTGVVQGNLVKVLAWYDNEWGYSNRLVDTITGIIGRKPHRGPTEQ